MSKPPLATSGWETLTDQSKLKGFSLSWGLVGIYTGQSADLWQPTEKLRMAKVTKKKTTASERHGTTNLKYQREEDEGSQSTQD